MNLTVIGTGYVGLVTGTCLADMGNNVTCVDIDEDKVALMQKGKIPIYEPNLEELFKRNINRGRLHFTTNLKESIKDSTIIFLALPTPQDEDGSADLSYVKDVAHDLGKLIDDYKIIINKSTVPVGTSDIVKDIISSQTDIEFDVVSNPEFLREGYAVKDFMEPERIIIGSKSEKAKSILSKLYKPFITTKRPIIFMDERSSELTKYASNCFLATKITFMNEVANLCEIIGSDVDMVRIGMGSDSRIGNRFLYPGIGYGGSCFPKDVNALVKSSDEANYDFKILKSVIEVNVEQKKSLVPKVSRYFNGDLKDKKIAIWGLAFKPNTDDVREAPAIDVINELLLQDVEITAYDPEAMPNIKRIYGDKIKYGKNAYDILENADCLLICTEWSEFTQPSFNRMKSLLKEPVIFDGRNMFDLEVMENNGFYYESVGRKIVTI
ncbi:UDP-glucose/GDP-mannose dehydrogenase family protein [Aureibaculum sp. 2210JD6-5]|uniref:UDP-glucose dehydrogenase family protein n=1 Tax=Aureibaculum sp. 2210JD6-5 TaxID=3103957 RepID=UPI002AAE988E|nr:UDP-glucose/GDP-mannose dehydrogenase family protein [Aureibaculum sp. 2210JD6-5]MDY7396201.1 UDP-glucose/GDP-mannose dehydrogenase family protein [Aureibaculum sp. 2210JD6-5]